MFKKKSTSPGCARARTAALKPPHSKRWRDLAAPSNLSGRLECGGFSAAFAPWFKTTDLTSKVNRLLVAALPRAVLFSLIVLLTSCRTAALLPKIDLSQPGWTVHQGQAVWRANSGAPEIAGDLLLATSADGRTLVQFTKTPFPTIVAQTAPGFWQIESPAENKHHTGRGAPPERLLWFQLPRALSGSTLPHAWSWRISPDHWQLENSATGESLQGYLSP
jgi:hypothetical protein